jgi:hypothetical protein
VVAVVVPSSSRPGLLHAVVVGEQVLCTCEAYQHRQHCKHLAAVLPTVSECGACGSTVTHLDNVVACDRCEWAAVN